MHSFGARLRSQRETQGVALDEISRQTKIKVSLLEALERDDLSHWPHGLFGRAYLRAYAKTVGIDPEPLIRTFLELHPDPPDEFLNAEPAARAGLSSTIRSAVQSFRELRRPGDKDVLPAPAPAPSLAELASLCTRISTADGPSELGAVLRDVAQLLGATGLVLWSWDAAAAALKPCLAHGYPDHVVAQFPPVRRHEDNAIAAAFRSMEVCTVGKGDRETGALVAPLVVSGRCVGTLSLELRNEGEQRDAVRDAAIILASLLVPLADILPTRAAATA